MPPYSSMFAFAPFLLWLAVVLFRPIRPTDDGNHQEDKDPDFVDVPEGDND